MTEITRKFKKRKRVARPWSLKIVSVALIAFPLVNLLALSWQYGYPLLRPDITILRIDIFALLLLFLPLPIGIGLLLVKKWAWWSLLIYTGLLISYNLYVAIGSPAGFNYLALVQSAIGMGVLIFFLRKDISAPYFKMHPRGWRGQKRNPVSLPLRLGEREVPMVDLSLSGLYAKWPDCRLDLNSSIEIEIQPANSEPLKLQGGVVRVDGNGIGVAFRGLRPEERERLTTFLAA